MFCRHIQKYACFVYYKKSPPEAADEDWSQIATEIMWWDWWRCNEIHIKVNLGQIHERNLGG